MNTSANTRAPITSLCDAFARARFSNALNIFNLKCASNIYSPFEIESTWGNYTDEMNINTV